MRRSPASAPRPPGVDRHRHVDPVLGAKERDRTAGSIGRVVGAVEIGLDLRLERPRPARAGASSAAARRRAALEASWSSRTGFCEREREAVGIDRREQLRARRAATTSGSCRRAAPAGARRSGSRSASSSAARRMSSAAVVQGRCPPVAHALGIIGQPLLPRSLTGACQRSEQLPPGRARVRRLDHQRRRRAAVGGRAAVVGDVGCTRAGAAVHLLCGRRSAGRARGRPPDPGVLAADRGPAPARLSAWLPVHRGQRRALARLGPCGVRGRVPSGGWSSCWVAASGCWW